MVRLFFISICLLSALITSAQKNWNTRGLIGVYSDHYAFQAKNDSSLTGRRPNSLTRFVITPYFSYKKHLKVPVTLIFSANQTNTLTPASKKQDVSTFLYNPANIIRIAPTYKWATLEIGSLYPQYSELTVGNISIFGAGLTLNPGKFLFEVSYGVSQRAIAPDSSRSILGAYERTLLNTKIGFGHIDSSYFFINATYANDITNSLALKPVNITPEQGFAIAPSFGLRITKNIQWVNEVGISFHTLNKLNDITEEITLPLTKFINYNVTSKADFAASSSIKLKSKSWSMLLKGLFVGPGYTTFGYPYFQNDRIDLTASPQVRLLKNKIILSGTGGYRLNNLLETKSQTNTQILASINTYAVITSKLSLNATYSNFGFQNDATSDSLKIQQISNTITITPNYYIEAKKGTHTISITYSKNDLSSFNTVSASNEIIKSNNVGTYYSFLLKNKPLTINAGVDYFENNAIDIGSKTSSVTLGVGYKLFKRKLIVSASAILAKNNRINYTTDNRLGAKFKLTYKSKSKYLFSLAVSNNNYQYGSFRPNASFYEWFLKTGITKSF